MAKRLFDFVRTIRSVSGAVQPARMTKREREITDLVAQGMSNKQIAHTLNIAVYTVKSHVHNILQKLALDTRLDIAAYVQRTDLPHSEAPAQHP